MKIIYARMQGYNWSVPSDAVARELEKLGHKIVIVDNMDYLPTGRFDFVWSPYESVTVLGDAISKKLLIPHYAHIEWLPPWRIKKVIPEQYGFTPDHPEIINMSQSKVYYEHIGKAWLNANVRSLGGECFKPYLIDIFNNEFECYINYPCIDIEVLNKAKQMYSPKRIPNQIISVARAVPNKRYDLIIKVINQLTIPIEWVVVGEGPDIQKIKTEVINNNITLSFRGAFWGWGRLYEFLKSSLFLGVWSGMPPLEAAVLGCYPILLSFPKTNENIELVINEYFRNHIETYNGINTQLSKVTNAIIQHLGKDKDRQCKNLEQLLLDNKLGITTAEQRAKNIVMQMNKGF